MKYLFFSILFLSELALSHNTAPSSAIPSATTCDSPIFKETGRRGLWDNRKGLNRLRPRCNKEFREQNTWVVDNQCKVIETLPNRQINFIEGLRSGTEEDWLNNYMRNYFAVALSSELKKIDPNLILPGLSCLNTSSSEFKRRIEKFNSEGISPIENLQCKRVYELAILNESYTGEISIPGNLGQHQKRILHQTPFFSGIEGNRVHKRILQKIKTELSTTDEYKRWSSSEHRFGRGTISKLVRQSSGLGQTQDSLHNSTGISAKLESKNGSEVNKAEIKNTPTPTYICPEVKDLLKKRRLEGYRNLCSGNLNIAGLKRRFPHIFDQAILDMNPIERSAADLSLCKKRFYYKPDFSDYDCDGILDSDDESPNDPLSPNNSFSFNERFQGPTFGAGVNYNVNLSSTTPKTLSVGLNVEIAYIDPRLSKEQVIQKFKSCGQRFHSLIRRSFDTFHINHPDIEYSEFEFDFNIYLQGSTPSMERKLSFEELPQATPSSPQDMLQNLRRNRAEGKTSVIRNNNQVIVEDRETNVYPTNSAKFNIWKCYCSDCPPWRMVNGIEIENTSCLEDFSLEQQRVIAESGITLRNRADAANLVFDNGCEVFQHEFLHRFGVEDEYSDPISYPYNIVDHCNLMNGNTEIILPRQIMQILSPKRGRACELY